MDELDAEQKAEHQRRQAMLERRAEHERQTGRRPLGRPPIERPKRLQKRRRVNLTDPDSRSVKTPRGFIQGYTGQLVAAEGQIIVAADVTTGSPDQGRLAPMVQAAQRELHGAGAPGPDTVLADAGYWRAGDIQQLTASGLTVLVPPDAHTRSEPLPGKRGGLYQRMRERLAAPDAAALYRRRMTMIEPIFGHTKANRRIERFQRRGLDAVRSEWRLIAATHNLLKLHTAATTA
jgi:hypothetical protein